jgi:hypothetical protein
LKQAVKKWLDKKTGIDEKFKHQLLTVELLRLRECPTLEALDKQKAEVLRWCVAEGEEGPNSPALAKYLRYDVDKH